MYTPETKLKPVALVDTRKSVSFLYAQGLLQTNTVLTNLTLAGLLSIAKSAIEIVDSFLVYGISLSCRHIPLQGSSQAC